MKTYRNNVKNSACVAKVLVMLSELYVNVSEDRVVDFCVFVSYMYKNTEKYTISQQIGPSSVNKFSTSKRGRVYYEDLWLKELGLSRSELAQQTFVKKSHPLAKYIFVIAEETTKRRKFNQEPGYMLCQISTLGWCPISPSCLECVFLERCQNETKTKYPELYRIRQEYGDKSEE